jgi:hypothetical protein
MGLNIIPRRGNIQASKTTHAAINPNGVIQLRLQLHNLRGLLRVMLRVRQQRAQPTPPKGRTLFENVQKNPLPNNGPHPKSVLRGRLHIFRQPGQLNLFYRQVFA